VFHSRQVLANVVQYHGVSPSIATGAQSMGVLQELWVHFILALAGWLQRRPDISIHRGKGLTMRQRGGTLADPKLLVRSPYLHTLQKGDQFLVWHSLFGNPTILNEDAHAYLARFSEPTARATVQNLYEGVAIADQPLSTFRRLRFINPLGFDERAFLQERIQRRSDQGLDGSFIDYLELRASEACNFACSYCIAQNATRVHNRRYKKLMDLETAKKAVDLYAQLLLRTGKKRAEMTFGGGEPTLNWPLIQQTIDYIDRTYSSQLPFLFYLNSNLSLLDRERIAFIKAHRVRISPSIDGPNAVANDRTRKTSRGEGTFETIMASLQGLRRAGVRLRSCSVTTNQTNFAFVERRFIDWAQRQGFRSVNVNIDVMNDDDLEPAWVASRLMEVVRYARELQIGVSGFWRRPAENLGSSLLRHRTGFCGAVRGDNLVVDPAGDIYSCGYSNQVIGSAHSFASFFDVGGRYHRFLQRVAPLSQEYCRGCEIEGYCGGGCLATQEFNEKDNRKVRQMCELYRLMTRELLLDLV